MKIGISSNYLSLYGLDAGLAYIRRLGYDCLDYSELAKTETPIYQASEQEFEHQLRVLRTKTESLGLSIAQTHGPWRYPPHDYSREQRAERFEKMAKAIRATALIGCHYMVIHPLMPFGPDQDPEPDTTFSINLDFMGKLSEVGRQNNVVICLENMPMTQLSLSRPIEIFKFVQKLNTPWLRICLDTGHAAVFGESPAEAVRLFGKEYLKVLHVHDNEGHHDFHWIPYCGVINWPDFQKALHEINFDGVLSLETIGSSKIPLELREDFDRGLVKIARHLAE